MFDLRRTWLGATPSTVRWKKTREPDVEVGGPVIPLINTTFLENLGVALTQNGISLEPLVPID